MPSQSKQQQQQQQQPVPAATAESSSTTWRDRFFVLNLFWTILTNLLDILLWIFWGEASSQQAGQSAEHPLEIEAVPGLTTLLDIALFRAVEAELTGTIHTSHALLQVWLDVQTQSRRVLQLLQTKKKQQQQQQQQQQSQSQQTSSAADSTRRLQLESFAKSCHEGACDMIERMSTDRFAQTANLSDPYESPTLGERTPGGGFEGASSHHFYSNNSTNNKASGSSNNANSNNNSNNTESILLSLQDSCWDTGRRRLPVQQRPRDCWESARLHCPDYVWGDEVAAHCQKTLRHLVKHPFCSATLADWNRDAASSLLLDEPSSEIGGSGGGGSASFSNTNPTGYYNNSNHNNNSKRSSLLFLTNLLEREEAHLLLQLILVDVSTRLSQFKTALEAESVVSKRLYLVKCEYRAPLRAFWEAHSSVQRAPRLELVQQSLARLKSSSSSSSGTSSSSNKEHRRRSSSTQPQQQQQEPQSSNTNAGNNNNTNAKDRLQELLESKELVELLALERQMEQYELDMALALFPFCELARYLDKNRAVPKRAVVVAAAAGSGSAGAEDLYVKLVVTLQRLKQALVTTSSSTAAQARSQAARNSSSMGTTSHHHHHHHYNQESAAALSSGIRPLLLDLQGIPRDDQDDGRPTSLMLGQDYQRDVALLHSPTHMAVLDARVDDFVQQLKVVAKLCSEKQRKRAFVSEKQLQQQPQQQQQRGSMLSSSSAESNALDPPSAAQCNNFDAELFKCQFKDWYNMAVRQHEITTETVLEEVDSDNNNDNNKKNNKSSSSKVKRRPRQQFKIQVLSEEIRRAEMAVSLSLVTTEPALKKIQERVEGISSDRRKRFEILKTSLEDLCLREMNWHVTLSAPPIEHVLELRSTFAGNGANKTPILAGMFGIALIQAKQVLPLG